MILATGSVALRDPRASSSATASSTPGAPGRCPSLPKSIAVVGAGASGRRDRLRLRPLRHRGDADRDARRRSSRPRTRTSPASSSASSRSRASRSSPAPRSTTSRPARTRSRPRYGDEAIEVDYLAIAGGRAPDTEALGLDAAGVKLGDGGKIEIDEYQRTSNPKVYAIGDLVRGPALAHKASGGGRRRGRDDRRRADPPDRPRTWSPGATFCHPQVASVGLTEAAGQGGRPRRQDRQA